MITIAIEGPSHAGKTTLIQGLMRKFQGEEVIALPEYVDAVDDLSDMPNTPASSVEDELTGLKFLLDIDHKRWVDAISVCPNPQIVLMNRSIHTLLAHRYALEILLGLPVFAPSCELASESHIVVWPEFIFYIDVSQEVLDSRYGRRQEKLSIKAENLKPNPIFVDAAYNKAFRSYFIPKLQYTNDPLIQIAGERSADETTEVALQLIQSLVSKVC